jgi:hypothetical protein
MLKQGNILADTDNVQRIEIEHSWYAYEYQGQTRTYPDSQKSKVYHWLHKKQWESSRHGSRRHITPGPRNWNWSLVTGTFNLHEAELCFRVSLLGTQAQNSRTDVEMLGQSIPHKEVTE